MNYRAEIDGLRTVAVVPVILFHAGLGAFAGGYVGVDIFFVISGYLITSILITEIAAGSFSILRFYERRARRILPALFFVMACCAPFAWIWMYPSQLMDFGRAVIAVIFFVSNILFWREIDYFAPSAEENPLLHTWSLAVEEQYYIFFPLLLLLAWRLGRPRLIAVLVIGYVVSLGLAEWGWRHVPGANFYLIFTRAWELLAGSLCAFVLANRQPWANTPLSIAGLAMIIAPIFIYDDQTPFPSLYALVPVMGAVLVILCGGAGTLTARVLSWRPMVGLGLISYSAYLWHQPLFAFARLRSLSEPSHATMAALVVTTLLLAWFSWRFVEQPFRGKSGSLLRGQRGLFAGAAIGAAAFMAFGIVVLTGQGFASRIAPSGQSFAALDIDGIIKADNRLDLLCAGSMPDSPRCTDMPAPRVMLWGDSFAMHLAPALLADDPGLQITQFTRPVCAPILDIAIVNAKYTASWARDCVTFNDQALAYLQAHGSIAYVVMSSPLGILESAIYQRDVGVRQGDLTELVHEKMLQTAAAIRAAGATPVFVSPPPRTGADLSSCATKLRIFGRVPTTDVGPVCSFPEAAQSGLNQKAAAMLLRLDQAFGIVWLDKFLCREGRCATVMDDVILFRDTGHFTRAGSALLGARYGLAERIYAACPDGMDCAPSVVP